MMDCKKRNIACALFVLGLCIGSYVLTPLGWDQRISVAFAQQADLIGSFPGNVIDSWTLRGVGYKYLTYFFYKAGTSFVDYQDKCAFEIVFKMVVSAFILIILGASCRIARKTLQENGIRSFTVFMLGCISFFTVSHWISFQAEDMSALILIFAMACAICKSRVFNLLAGFVLALLFTMKGVTVVLGVNALLVLFLIEQSRENRHRRLLYVSISYVLFSILLLLAIVLFIPSEIYDLKDAALFQLSSRASIIRRFLALAFGITYFNHTPILILGGFSAIVVSFYLFLKKEAKAFGVLFLLWMIPAAVVTAQGKGFPYHYAVMIPSAMISIVWVMLLIRERGRYEKASQPYSAGSSVLTVNRSILLTWMVVGIMVVSLSVAAAFFAPEPLDGITTTRILGLLLGLAMFASGLAAMLYKKDIWRKIENILAAGEEVGIKWYIPMFAACAVIWSCSTLTDPYVKGSAHDHNVYGRIREEFSLDEQPAILYLSDGYFTYYMEARSCLRYFYPLPLQRSTRKKSLRDTDIYRTTLAKALKYDGKYILLQEGWFHLDDFPELQAKIEKEYDTVYKENTVSRFIHVLRKKHSI